MTVQTSGNTVDMAGSILVTSGITVGGDSQGTAAASKVTLTCGTGAPSSVTATKGSIYSRLDGSSTSTRLYVNTDGGTTWTAVTTAA